jgi:hypothetical protein
MLYIKLAILATCMVVLAVTAFSPASRVSIARAQRSSLSMEYIPSGMSKAQWEAIKKKEKEETKDKQYGAVGITKFKSRSFEAWQKSGGKNLFPVSPDTPEDEKPYMQRKGGRADGEDLKKRGLFGRGQAAAAKRLDVDDKYDQLEATGALRSTTFEMPWTNSAAKKLAAEKAAAAAGPVVKKGAVKKAGKPSPYGAKAKAARAAAAAAAEPEPPAPKKKMFGLF